MIIFKDVFTGDEVGSDSFPLEEKDDVIYQLQGKMITVREGSYDIGCSGDVPEEESAAGEDVRSVIDVVEAFKLQEMPFDKKSFMTYIKGYMKRVKEHLEANKADRVQTFMTGAQNFVKKMLGEFDDYQFYSGESMDLEAMVIICKYLEDGVTPYVVGLVSIAVYYIHSFYYWC